MPADSELPVEGISVVMGVGRGAGKPMVVADVHRYDLRNGGVTTTRTELHMVEDNGLLWWPMDELSGLVANVLDLTDASTALSWLMPGADAGSNDGFLHYQALPDSGVFEQVTSTVPPQEIYELQGYAAVQSFQAVVQCKAMELAGLRPTGARMLCDEVGQMLVDSDAPVFASDPMRQSNGLRNGGGTRELFRRLDIEPWLEEIWLVPSIGDVLQTARTGARMLWPNHDSLPTRRGAAESDTEEGSCQIPCIGGIIAGGWGMFNLFLPYGKLTGSEDFDRLFLLDAAREGLGPEEACWVLNCVKSGGVHEALRQMTGLSYEEAAAAASDYFPWGGERLEVVKGILQIGGKEATAEALASCFGGCTKAMAYVLWETACRLTESIMAMSRATGIEIESGSQVAVVGGLSKNAAFMAVLKQMLADLGLEPRVPSHAGGMTENAGLAKVLVLVLGIPFVEALRAVQRVCDGKPAY